MVSKESSVLFFVAGCIFFLFSGTCQAQESGPIEIGNAGSHQQELLHTAKDIGNVVIQEIEAAYGLPENYEELEGQSTSQRSGVEDEIRSNFATRLENRDNFIAIKKNRRTEVKGYVIEDKKMIAYILLSSERIPGATINVFDCKENKYSSLAIISVSYFQKRKEKWEVTSSEVKGSTSVEGKSPPQCFGTGELLISNKYEKIEHGNHYHYVPHNRDEDVPISRFPTEPPGPGERITSNGDVVSKNNQ